MTRKIQSTDGRYDTPDYSAGGNPKPTRGPLERRSASPDKYATSGMELAMSKHADQVHKVK